MSRPWSPTDGQRLVAGIAGVVVAAVVGASMSFARPVPTLMPDQSAGTCHLAEDPNELIAIPSDSGPDVPCTQAHQTETMWVTTVTGPLAASKSRPNGELLNQKISGRCYDYQRERTYLGASPYDVTWGILSWARFPTAAAWAKGDRTLVCQGSSTTDGPIGPTIDYSIAGIMTTRRSDKFRLCRAPAGAVTCEVPHTMEDTSPNVNLTGLWPGSFALASTAVNDCIPIVDTYLGQPIASRPELVIRPDMPTFEQWTAGNKSINCWIATADGGLVTGTVRGGLT
jgi:hypothetical protein